MNAAFMHRADSFYKNAAILVTGLIVITMIAAYLCVKHTLLVDRLLPASKSEIPWTIVANSDADKNGESRVRVDDATQRLDYSFFLSDAIEYGYASVAMKFNDESRANGFADLSRYLRLRFRVKCSPANTLSFTVFTFDEKLTDVRDPDSYRIPTAFFSCDDAWSVVEIDLQHLEIPEWWLNLHKMKLSDREYQLSQSSRLSFGVSLRSPKNVDSSVKIADIELIERDWFYLYVFLAFSLSLWLGFGFWFFRNHTRVLTAKLEEKIQKNKQLIAYQQVNIEPRRNNEKSAVLGFMATEYANPELSLEAATSAIGVSKAKINSVLKDETGLTFSAYLNKLRLTEAARLLAEEPDTNVSVIAFSVGYNNVSYFNKLFKNEYGASPKSFRSGYKAKSGPEDPAADGIVDGNQSSPDGTKLK